MTGGGWEAVTKHARGFTTYIASGGDRDFMRPVAGALYGIPPERVIGSALGITYRADQDNGTIRVARAPDLSAPTADNSFAGELNS